MSSHNTLFFKMIYGNFSDVITPLIESHTLEQVKLTWHRVLYLRAESLTNFPPAYVHC